MNEVNVKQLIDQGQRTALLLGMITGGIASILDDINKGIFTDIEDVFNALLKIDHDAREKIISIYYHNSQGVEHD